MAPSAFVVGPILLAETASVATAIMSIVTTSADMVKVGSYVKGENVYFYTVRN